MMDAQKLDSIESKAQRQHRERLLDQGLILELVAEIRRLQAELDKTSS